MVVSLMGESLLEPEFAMDRVDRYGKHSSTFLMNQGRMNHSALPSLLLDANRSAFEIRVRNAALSSERHRYRLGSSELNRKTLPCTVPDFRWLQRQHDIAGTIDALNATESSASLRITQWAFT